MFTSLVHDPRLENYHRNSPMDEYITKRNQKLIDKLNLSDVTLLGFSSDQNSSFSELLNNSRIQQKEASGEDIFSPKLRQVNYL